MRHLIKTFAAILTLGSLNANALITEQSVSRFIEKGDKVINSKSIWFLNKAIAKDANIKFRINGLTNSIDLQMTKSEYVKSIEQSFAISETFKIKRLSTDIDIDQQKGLAHVKTVALETLSANGQTLEMKVNSTMTIEDNNGEHRIITFHGNI